MRELNRRFKDNRGVPVRVIRWEPETQRVIYLRDGYPHECFSPLEQFRQKFREILLANKPPGAPAGGDIRFSGAGVGGCPYQ